jgi:hypothetical protein
MEQEKKYIFANLTEEQMKKLSELEKELGVALIAYESEHSKRGSDQIIAPFFTARISLRCDGTAPLGCVNGQPFP